MAEIRNGADWWRNAVIYQIYPRSFRDANGDGEGDLQGVCSKLDYLRSLGVDAIWLSPFYPSPLADGGYDVADYRAVDPRFGTMTQFDALVAAAHAAGIRVLVDIVPNHTSERHPWFQAALAAQPGSPERARYVFRQGKGEHGELPPTNWLSNFGGSAWEPCGDGWYYLHLFAREQPDLNWDNPEVRAEFLDILKFWCGKGVDGFRVDVSHGLAKDLRDPLRDRINPMVMSPEANDGSDPLWDRDAVHEIYRGWRELFDRYSPPKYAVGESWTPFTERVFQYAQQDELGAVFDFSLQKGILGSRRILCCHRPHLSVCDAGRHGSDLGPRQPRCTAHSFAPWPAQGREH
jgi:alpha-glucosidase